MEREFVELLPLIDRVVAFLARRYHLSAADADDFASHVKIRLIEDEYAVLRKFEGRSTMRTFLTTVITRLFQDWRNSVWGKWRPSAEAKRQGPLALRLEELLVRDGRSMDESYEILTTNHGLAVTRPELEAIAASLPVRIRRRFENDQTLEAVPAAETADATMMERERLLVAERATGALRKVLADLPSQDALILTLRYSDGKKVSEIARILNVDQKPLYPRIENLLRRLRRALEDEGVDADTSPA